MNFSTIEMKRKSRESQTLAHAISNVLSVAPDTIDSDGSEGLDIRSDDIYDLQLDGQEICPSELRKQNSHLLEQVDKKYIGIKSLRQNLEEHEWKILNCKNTDLEYVVTGFEGNSEASCSRAATVDYTKFNQIEKVKSTKTLQKGICVRNQINIWETLLEIRIQLQQWLNNSNKLSKSLVGEIQRQLQKSDPKFCETRKYVENVLDKLLLLELLLLKQFPETNNLFKIQGSDEQGQNGIGNNMENTQENQIPHKKMKLDNYEHKICFNFKTYTPYRNSVIKKWTGKSRIATLKPDNSLTPSLYTQIESVLNNKHELIERSRMKCTSNMTCDQVKCSGTSNVEEEERYDPEIFDDTDFYRKMLEEFIDIKSADVTDPVKLSRQWNQLHNVRRKIKRNIDTRATKGRKIRHTVHNKLVNFMAPINDAYVEGNRELYNSLFGKNRIINKL